MIRFRIWFASYFVIVVGLAILFTGRVIGSKWTNNAGVVIAVIGMIVNFVCADGVPLWQLDIKSRLDRLRKGR